MKKILVPTDFSTDATKAYTIAASLARKNNAEIHFINLIKEYHQFSFFNFSNSFFGAIQLEIDEVNAVKKLNDLCEKDIFKGIKTTFSTDLILHGENISHQLKTYIKHKKFSLMIIGTSKKNSNHISIAEKVANHASIPVLTIHHEHKTFSPKKIMLCTNFKDINSAFIHSLENFALAFRAKIEVVFINSKNHHYDNSTIIQQHRLFNTRFKYSKPELQIYNGNHIVESICHAATKQCFDLIAMTTHGHHGFYHLLHHNKTERIIRNANVPVYSWNMLDIKTDKNIINTISINRGMMY